MSLGSNALRKDQHACHTHQKKRRKENGEDDKERHVILRGVTGAIFIFFLYSPVTQCASHTFLIEINDKKEEEKREEKDRDF